MPEEKETGRIEAFSDGVFAIAVTLLILDVKVPRITELTPGKTLGFALLHQWPAYLAYVMSFLTILIMWVNHHKMFGEIKRSDHWFLILNGLLLMMVSIIPFPTALLAEYIRHPYAQTAAAVYTGTHVVLAVVFNLLWRYASANGRLLRDDHDKEFIENINRQYAFGPLLYLICFGLAFVSVTASVGLALALAVFFALPTKTNGERAAAGG